MATAPLGTAGNPVPTVPPGSGGANPLPGQTANPTPPTPNITPTGYSNVQTGYDANGNPIYTSGAGKPPTISANGLTGNTTPTPIALPSPTTTNATTSIPSLDQILAQYEQPSAATVKATGNVNDLTSAISDLLVKQGTQSAVEEQLNATPGGVNDINAQLNEINKQITSLNDQAFAATQTSENRQAPMFAITGEQAQIARQKAVQMYGLSAAASALQGDLSLAQDKVKTALSAEFDPIKAQIAAYQNLLTTAQDEMTTAQKTDATNLQAALTERDNLITQQQADKKNIYDTMLTAAQNGAPNTVINAILNAGSANDAITAAGNYLQAPKTLSNGQIMVDANGNIIASNNGGNDGGYQTVPVQNPDGTTTNVPADVAPYYFTSYSGTGYVDASTLQGTAAQKTQIIREAQQAGLVVITNKNTATDLFNITDANNKLDTVAQTLQGIDQPGWLQRTAYSYLGTKAASALQSNPQQAAAGVLSSIGTDILKAMQGVQGSRMSQAAVANINKELPTIYDTQATVDAKIQNLRNLLNDRENAILKNQQSTTAPASNSALPSNVQTLLQNNLSFSSDGKTAYLPRAIWSQLGSSMDAVLAEAKADGFNLLIQ